MKTGFYNTAVIIVSVGLNAAAQLFLKKGAEAIGGFSLHQGLATLLHKLANLPIFLGFLCYAISIVLWIFALSKVQVSIAYPFQALGYILVVITASLIFHEAFTVQKLIGVVLISAGVICIAQQMG